MRGSWGCGYVYKNQEAILSGSHGWVMWLMFWLMFEIAG